MARKNVERNVEREEEETSTRSRRARGPVEKSVYVVRGNEIIRKFEYDSDSETGKMPRKQAHAFLTMVLENPDHTLHEALKRGEISTIEGKSEVRKPRQELRI